MELAVSSTLLCLLGVTLLPTVSATIVCKGYWDTSGDYRDVQKCGYSVGSKYFCCGDCSKKYCCSDAKHRLSEEEQDRCPLRRTSKIPYIIGTVVGSILPVIICVGLIICCVSPCCFLYKRFHRNRSHNLVIDATAHTTLVTTPPQQPQASPGHPQSYQGAVYQSMPLQPGYGVQPMPQGGHGPPMPGYRVQPMPQGVHGPPMPGYRVQPMPQGVHGPPMPGYRVQPMPQGGRGLPMASAPPPSYMEVGDPGYSSLSLPYNNAAFSEGLEMYPLRPPNQPSAPTPCPDERAPPPSYNPSY